MLPPVCCFITATRVVVFFFAVVPLLSYAEGKPQEIKLELHNSTQFLLYTRNYSKSPMILNTNTDEVFTYLPMNLNVKILIHGLFSHCYSEFAEENKKSFLIEGNYIIICMDWSASASGLSDALDGIKPNTQMLIDFIKWLDVPLAAVHLIGHSLGVHIAGLAARNLRENSDEVIARITALDPAWVSYFKENKRGRLVKDDALLVDVIHTTSEPFSVSTPLGHLDFYPNGGDSQPGCDDVGVGCSHSRAHQLLAESIRNPGSFRAKRCANQFEATQELCSTKTDVCMGQIDTYRNGSNGIYYLKTNGNPPYDMSETTSLEQTTDNIKQSTQIPVKPYSSKSNSCYVDFRFLFLLVAAIFTQKLILF